MSKSRRTHEKRMLRTNTVHECRTRTQKCPVKYQTRPRSIPGGYYVSSLLGFIPALQEWFNTRQPTHVIQHEQHEATASKQCGMVQGHTNTPVEQNWDTGGTELGHRWKRTGSAEINPHSSGQRLFNNIARTISLTNGPRRQDAHMQNNELGPSPHILHTNEPKMGL